MNRILEFTPSQEEAVVSRILVLVHQAMDEHLPSAGQATRQFTKTVFSEETGESTSPLRLASETEAPAPPAASSEPPRASAFGSDEATSPLGRPSDHDSVPPTPPLRPMPATVPPPPRAGAQTGVTTPARQAVHQTTAPSAPVAAPEPPESGQKPTGLDTTMQGIKATQKADWVTRITLALLVAGLVILAYVALT